MAELTDIPKIPRDTATIAPVSRAEKDLQLWHSWKKTKSSDDLRSLLRAFDPVVHKFVSQYTHSGVPQHALETETKLNAVKAFHNYDPSKGTQLNTHVTNMLQKGQRMVYENKGLTRIPEHRATRISTYMSVHDFLKEKLGRDPSLGELQDELASSHQLGGDDSQVWSKPEIERMQKELHKTLLSSEDTLGEMAVQKPTRESELLDYVYYELTPQEQAVYEHLTGRHGKPIMDGINIAKKLNMTPSRVSRIRQRIAEKFEKYREKPMA